MDAEARRHWIGETEAVPSEVASHLEDAEDTPAMVREALLLQAGLDREARQGFGTALVELARQDPEVVAVARAVVQAIWRGDPSERWAREPLHAFVLALRMLAVAPHRGDVELLARVAGAGYFLADASNVAAAALERLATTDPCPELRVARRYLQGGALHLRPPACAAAWKAIDAATAHAKDLPVTTSAPDHDADLPRPAEGPDGDH